MDDQKRKWHNSFYGNKKKSKQFSMECGMSGFLCTCNFREKDCIRESYRLLEQYDTQDHQNVAKKDNADVLASNNEEVKDCEQEKNDENNEDISDALNREIEELNAQTKKPVTAKRFQYVDTGAKNVIFISTTVPNPLELAMRIIKDLDETKEQRSRFILRLIPVQIICRATICDIKLNASAICEKYFAQEPKTFAIVFNRHCNNTIQRNDVIETLAAVISKKNPGNRADLKNPEIAVVVEIIKSFCLLSIAPEYFKYKKYNLLELCNVNQEKEPKDKPSMAHENATEELGDMSSNLE